MLRMVPLPRCGRGGWGSHVSSPCGDVVLKCNVTDYYIDGVKSKFPSPCGDVVLKFATGVVDMESFEKEFPSPCGDVVLKLRLPEGQ